MKTMYDAFNDHCERDINGVHVGGTDKTSNHNYSGAYEGLFPDRSVVNLMMEIGVAEGASLLAWQEIFPHARVVGMDMHQAARWKGEFHYGDQRSKQDCERAAAGRKFDLIVEDATHKLENTLLTLFHLWPFVKQGGLYIVEEWENASTPSVKESIKSLFPFAEIVGTCGPHIADEPLIVLRKQ